MVLSKKITSKIWDKCAKQMVDGYIYVKMDDIIKLNLNEEDLIMDDLETLPPKAIYGNDPGDEHVKKPIKLNMDLVASYLTSKGFKYERSINGEREFWVKK
jgi:hypothetical protein